MLATDLLKLIKRGGACKAGYSSLVAWIRMHPKGTASQFFRFQAECGERGNFDNDPISGYAPTHRLRWAFIWLLDWSDEPGGRVSRYWAADIFAKKYFGKPDMYCIPRRELALALARAFED